VPFISVIVPVRNEGAFIAATLEQLLAQDYPADRFEILVADGGSTDDTCTIVAALAARHDNLRLLDNPRRWSSAGRNVAVKAARGDIVLLIDGHCEIDNPRYLADLADAFEQSGADCVGRPQPLDVTGATLVQRAIAAARSSRLGHHPDSHIYSDREGFVPPQSVAIAYRREVFDTIGFFDERFDACEDVEFNHRAARAGLSCYFTPRVRVRYHPRDSLTKLFRQMIRYGRGRVRLLRKHADTFSLTGFVPGTFVAGLVLGPLLAYLLPVLWMVYAGALAVYVVLLLATSLAISFRQREPAMAPVLPPVFATVHLGAGVGQCWEALGGSVRPNQLQTANGGEESTVAILPFPTARELPEPIPCPRRLNALTIDVEDYFHVSAFERCVDRNSWDTMESRIEDSTWRLLDCLADAEVRGTFFVLGWVAERHPDLVRSIRSAGHEIGCHTYSHRLIYEQTPEEFRADLRRGLHVLEDILGQSVRAFRAPSFSITRQSLWALDILVEEGITLDSSIYPTHHDRYGIPGTPLAPHRIDRDAGSLWEFPPPVYRFLGYPLPIGGGGYFRLYPYAFTRLGLARINAAGRPFAAYLHPWEFDPEQPRLRPGRLRAFRHYVNLSRTEPRLKYLLRDFTFGTLSEALAEYEPAALALANRRAA
jgi:polysaccharide deacetylase family protein (PEP-CTERM system associated)